MSHFDVIRAWKDAIYRSNLSAEEQALLPEHPASSIELDNAELNQVLGGEAEETELWGTFLGCNTQNGNFTSCGAGCR